MMPYNNTYASNPVPQERLHVNRLLLIESNEYQDMFLRNYTLFGNSETINQMNNIIQYANENRQTAIPENLIATDAPDVIKLSDSAIRRADMSHGWRQKRYMFLMEVISPLSDTDVVHDYFQGYTEHNDSSFGGQIDPTMRFEINSVIQVTKSYNPRTREMTPRMCHTYNLLSGQKQTIDLYDPVGNIRVNRPYDVLCNMHNMCLTDAYGENNNELSVHTNLYGLNAYSSGRDNNSSTGYFTKVLNGFKKGMLLSSISHNSSDVFATGMQTVREANLMDVGLIRAASREMGTPGITYFTLDMLHKVDPDFKNKRIDAVRSSQMLSSIRPANGLPGSNMFGSTDTMSFNNPLKETNLALEITNSISSYMATDMITVLNISGMVNRPRQFTGYGYNDDPYEVFVSDYQSFVEGVRLETCIERIKAKVSDILMPKISHNRQLDVAFNARVDLVGDTEIIISIENGEQLLYRVPTFADSLFAPVISTNESAKILTADFENLSNMLYQ